jgi:hypothetical protein
MKKLLFIIPLLFLSACSLQPKVINPQVVNNEIQNNQPAEPMLGRTALYNSSGLVGYWTMDSSDIIPQVGITDKSGNGNTGTMVGFTGASATSSAQVLGKIGQGLKFDGVNDYVKIPNIAPSVFTATMWIKPSGTQSFYNYAPTLMGSNNYDNPVSGFIIEPYDPNNSLMCAVWTLAGMKNALTSNFTPKNQWTFVACIFNGTSVNMYVNSTLYAGTPFAATTLSNSPAYPLIIGCDYYHMNCVQGSLDDVRVFSRALSSSEIYNLYRWGLSKRNSY